MEKSSLEVEMLSSKHFYNFTFLDTETGGLGDDAEVLEIAIIRESRDGTKTERWSTLIKPERPEAVEVQALEINGITPDMWEDAPSLAEVAPRIIRMLKYGPLIGHNVAFDLRMLRNNLKRIGYNWRPGWPAICTQQMAWLHLPIPSVSLDACREYFGYSTCGSHRAQKDVDDCSILFFSILDLFKVRT